MKAQVDLSGIYIPSEDLVTRDIQDEFIIVPITSGIGDMDDSLYTLNETGRAVWDKMDGKKSLEEIVEELISEFDGSGDDIKKDVLGLTAALKKKNIVVEIKTA
ncbi:PqqD family protein [Candidatus Omnitrophota bacterium]